MPAYDPDTGKSLFKPDGTPERQLWNFGDQEILRWLISRWDPDEGTVWPRINDVRYGVADGLRSVKGAGGETGIRTQSSSQPLLQPHTYRPALSLLCPPRRYLPEFASMSDSEFAEQALVDRATGKPTVVGWKGAGPQPGGMDHKETGMFGLPAPVWRPLSVLYDPFVGNCECMPERDAPQHVFSVHFSWWVGGSVCAATMQ